SGAFDPAPQPLARPHDPVSTLATPIGPKPPRTDAHTVKFELLEDDTGPDSLLPVSPEIARGLREIAEFEKDRRGYNLAGQHGGFFSRFENSRPASWLYRKWRSGIGFVLKVLRWIDSWAYLISVPFVMLMIFGIVVANRTFVHIGAIVVVLANYG